MLFTSVVTLAACRDLLIFDYGYLPCAPFAQTVRLMRDRWAGIMGMDYEPGQSLTLYYWRCVAGGDMRFGSAPAVGPPSCTVTLAGVPYPYRYDMNAGHLRPSRREPRHWTTKVFQPLTTVIVQFSVGYRYPCACSVCLSAHVLASYQFL